jgi:hypothetical protein
VANQKQEGPQYQTRNGTRDISNKDLPKFNPNAPVGPNVEEIKKQYPGTPLDCFMLLITSCFMGIFVDARNSFGRLVVKGWAKDMGIGEH